MKALLSLTIFFMSVFCFGQATENGMIFHSSKELNQYRFLNSNLGNLTTGYLLDMEEEWTANQLDSFIISQQNDTTSVDGLLNFFNLLERTDVNYQFERDSILFPIMDKYISIERGKEVFVPLFLLDFKFSKLVSSKRNSIENWTSLQPFSAFQANHFETEKLFYASLFIDTLKHDKIHLYWDENTVFSNSNRTVTSVELKFGNEIITLFSGESLDLSSYLSNTPIESITIDIYFSDNSSSVKVCKLHLAKAPKNDENGNAIPKAFGDWQGEYGDDTHKVNWTVLFGCEDGRLNKPFIFVAGWGPYTGKNWLNNYQGWPTDENGLYQQWNQANVIWELRQYGFDVVIVRFTPPNASTQANADKLKYVINWVNDQKALANSKEENIILGYSAGAMGVRLTLDQMEKDHLENNGPHPHTKLFISYDGEHGGANIPLAAQHATKYLDTYQSGLLTFNIYALNYILNAPLSKELLRYFWEQTGSLEYPGQGPHGSRWELLQKFNDANHEKTLVERPGYPSFSRAISISNGMNESQYSGNGVNHFPYPSYYGHIPYIQFNTNREWHTAFNVPGGNVVFLYKKRFWPFGWSIQMEARTAHDCLVLDNAPGGMVFITSNPLTEVMKQMKAKIALGEPNVYYPHTQFCFTPTLLTHDIRNFNAASNGYKMNYNMKQNRLMFQSKQEFENYLLDPGNYTDFSDYWGYPHLAYPTSHYWEATPFDAVFSANYNTEHILFNNCTRNDLTNNNEEWYRLEDPSTSVVKNFILGEADYFNGYIQNIRYGWNARSDYIYSAEIIEPNGIYVGKEVTQRTNFKEAAFLSNSNVRLQAGEEIVLSSGTTIMAGVTFHAHIAPYHCDYFKSAPNGNGNGEHRASNSGSENENHEYKMPVFANEQMFTIYPNPSNGEVNIRNNAFQKTQEYNYEIFDLHGTLLQQGTSHEKITRFLVQKGIYIVKLKNHENTSSHKIVVH